MTCKRPDLEQGTSIFEFTLPNNPREIAEIHLIRTKFKSIIDAAPWTSEPASKIDEMKEELVRVFEWNDRLISNVPGGVYEFVMAWIWWIAGIVGVWVAWWWYKRHAIAGAR